MVMSGECLEEATSGLTQVLGQEMWQWCFSAELFRLQTEII